MMNKPKTLTLRYSTISPSLSSDKNGKFHSLIEIRQTKPDFNATLTKYRSIRELKKQQAKSQAAKNQRNVYQHDHSNQHNKSNTDTLLKNADIIQIIKLKLHENDNNTERTNLRVKTQYTMNRNELKNYIKKKKTFDFINNKSLEIIKSFFPKRLDLIINQIKSRKTEQHQKTIPNEIVIDLKNRPNSASGPTSKPTQLPSKPIAKTIERPNIKRPEMTHRKLIDHQIKQVSGWEINQEEEFIFGEQFVHKPPKSKRKHRH